MSDQKLLPIWAYGETALIEEPLSSYERGWRTGQKPPAEHANFLQKTYGEKINFILRSGAQLWDADTQYQTSDRVWHNGAQYEAARANTGKTPPTDGRDSDDWIYSATDEATPLKVVRRTRDGDIKARIFNSNDPAVSTLSLGSIQGVMIKYSNNNLIANSNKPQLREWLNTYSKSETTGLLSNYLPLAGGQMSGTIKGRILAAKTLSQVRAPSAPHYIDYAGNSSATAQFTPWMGGRTRISSGYTQEATIGAYRNGTGWNGGIYMSAATADNAAPASSRVWYFRYDGYLSHGAGRVLLQNPQSANSQQATGAALTRWDYTESRYGRRALSETITGSWYFQNATTRVNNYLWFTASTYYLGSASSAGGRIYSGSSSSSSMVVAAGNSTSAGAVILRPRGYGSSSVQSVFNANGIVELYNPRSLVSQQSAANSLVRYDWLTANFYTRSQANGVYARKAVGETITGSWYFSNSLRTGGNVQSAASSSIFGCDGSTNYPNIHFTRSTSGNTLVGAGNNTSSGHVYIRPRGVYSGSAESIFYASGVVQLYNPRSSVSQQTAANSLVRYDWLTANFRRKGSGVFANTTGVTSVTVNNLAHGDYLAVNFRERAGVNRFFNSIFQILSTSYHPVGTDVGVAVGTNTYMWVRRNSSTSVTLRVEDGWLFTRVEKA